MNPVQEVQNGAPSANMLTGLGIDEYFQRTDSSGASSLLADALGSTLAMADSSGAIQTSYTYEPFGNTTVSGASSTNPFQFTGRENDGTGMYFNRARYYSPMLQRFVSRDPIGFAGGDANLYAYGSNEPSDLTDLLGLDAFLCDRPLNFKHAPPEIGPFYHQYVCVVLNHATYCFGLTTYNGKVDFPESFFSDVPGGLEGGEPNRSCERKSTKRCVDSCLLDVAEQPPPDYNVGSLFGGMNCHEFAQHAIADCEAKCANSSD
jgi:RHS repeat-associated protein